MAKARTKSRILYIEDDRETAGLVAQELRHCGFAVDHASDGQEALLASVKASPDLILCAVNMPAMKGFGVFERLTEFAPRLGQVPLVFLAALSDRDTESKARQLGADDYVTKPIDFERLIFIINGQLKGGARAKLPPSLVRLNHREIEVLTRVARGNTSLQIGRQLHLSKRTIDSYIDSARAKLHATTRAEAVVKAAGIGLIKP
jgi:DNA-binding response OmpR family regulator